MLRADRRFVCRHYRACRASHTGAFFEGQLHHVGPHYDLTVDATPLRIVVVGQEYGHGPAKVSMQDRTATILDSGAHRRFSKQDGLAGRNPHLRGTTSLLRTLLGWPPGPDYAGEWLSISGRVVHLFEAFALVNFLLCSAVAMVGRSDREVAAQPTLHHGGQRGRATRVMQRHCTAHFTAAIQILDPTVIVAQGKAVRRWMRPSITHAQSLSAHLPIERVGIGGCHPTLLTFAHPSTPSAMNWGMNARQPYLVNTVIPTVRAVRRRLGLRR